MMAQPFPGVMAQGHPGMGHAHPMAGMQHPGGHMGGPPGPGMMQGMHPGVSGPQVTQGPMVTGMPQGAGTPAPGGPMHNGSMAMAHLGPQQAMFHQQNPQMNFTQMQMTQQQNMLRQQMMHRIQQQQQQQGIPMNMQNVGPGITQAQMAQMKMNIPMQQQLQMQAVNQHAQNFQHQQQQQQQQHQQRLVHAHLQQQQQQQAQQAQALANQRAAAQQMQLSRSQEQQQTTQAPQSHPTPAPQNQPPPQSQPTPQVQPQPAPPKPQPQPQVANSQQQNQPAPPVKQNEPEEEPQIKQQEPANNMMMQDIPKQDFNGQSVLQLVLYQDSLANPKRPLELEYWEEIIEKYFSPTGSLRQQLFNIRNVGDKSFQLQFPSLARFYHAHFVSGIKQILLQSYDHTQGRLPNGGTYIISQNATLTYVFNSDIRVTTAGSLQVNFNELNLIERLNITTTSWQEYIPRTILLQPVSPDQKQSPKMNKNVKRAQQQGKVNTTAQPNAPNIPTSGVGDWGVPLHIMQFLEIAEVMTQMGPLMEYFHTHPGISPRDSLMRLTAENQINFANANNARLQNQMARAANGQVFPPNMGPGMNGPNQFASPGMAHLGLPQGQGSPHIGGPVHTPSPAHNPAAGGVAMMHQMSAQGSNLSGSQGPSTNTSPNVSNNRRRASGIKLEDENASQESNGANRVKPSPRIGGKRQKGQA